MINARQYLISFLATISGHRAVTSGLTQMERGTKGYATATGKSTMRTQSFNDMLNKATKRALIVAPVWMMLRTIMMGFVRTIGDMVRAGLDLEEGMARIKTVVHGTASTVKADLVAIRSQILTTATDSRISIKELAEAFYFLKTASLSTQESMSAFKVVTDAMVGTGVKAKEMARAVAGIYNTMGQYMNKNLTIAEKMTKIGDALTYTYATQDVEMSELIAGYTKFAPYISGLTDDITEVITVLGFLNTKMLRGSRTGRLLGRAVLQITKNSKQLASVFNITFDPDKPVKFLDVISKVTKAMGATTKLTEKQSRALQTVFATRGGVPIRLLIPHFDALIHTLKLAEENMSGFNERMKEIRMQTVMAQAERFGNILKVMAIQFAEGLFGAGTMAQSLKELNDTFQGGVSVAKAYGDSIGYIFTEYARVALLLSQFTKAGITVADILNPGMLGTKYKEIGEAVENIIKMFDEGEVGHLTPDEFLKKRIEQEQKEADIIKKREASTKLNLDRLKEEKDILKSNVKIMKTFGAHALDIAKYKKEYYETLKKELAERSENINLAEYDLQIADAQLEILEAEIKYRKEIQDLVRGTGIQILQSIGASESQILEIKIRQLEADKESMGNTQYLLNFDKLRLQQVVALQKEKEKELQTATNLAMQYEKADAMERSRLRRMMELRGLSPEKLTKQYEEDMYDRTIIEEYWSNFSKEGQQAIGEVIRKMYDLPESPTGGLGEVPDNLTDIFAPTGAHRYWDEWTTRSRDALKEFGDEWVKLGGLGGGLGAVGKTTRDRIAINQKVDMSTTIENIEVKLPKNALDKVAEEASKKFKEFLENDEAFQKRTANLLRPYL